MRLAFILSLFSWHAIACDVKDPKAFQQCLTQLSTASEGPNFQECVIEETGNKKCDDRYKRLLHDGTVNVTIASGYGDINGAAHSGTFDRETQKLTKETLLRSCPSTMSIYVVEEKKACDKPPVFDHSCGFKQTDNPDIIEKRATIRGKEVAVQIKLMTSSLTSWDQKNRDSTKDFISQHLCKKKSDPKCINKYLDLSMQSKVEEFCVPGDEHKFQVCRSAYVRNSYVNAITNGDELVMYNGHARDSGGPSFNPPEVLPNKKVNYAYYHRERPGHKLETKALEIAAQRGKPPVFYASHSCSSHKHFLENGNLKTASPLTAYILSSQISTGYQGSASALATINSALAGACEQETEKNIQGASCVFNLYNH